MDLIWEHWSDLALVFAAFALAVGSPGPSTMAIMGTSMSEGRSTGLTLALGVRAVRSPGVFLQHLAYRHCWRRTHRPFMRSKLRAASICCIWRGVRRKPRAMLSIRLQKTPGQSPNSKAWTVLRGYLMHLTNPKAILGWTAIMALGLKPDMRAPVVLAMLAGCLAISLSFNCGYAVLFSTSVHGSRLSPNAAMGAVGTCRFLRCCRSQASDSRGESP